MESGNTIVGLLTCSAGYLAADLISHPFNTVWAAQQARFYQPGIPVFEVIYQINKQKRFFDGFSMQAMSSVPGTFLYLQGREFALKTFGDNYLGQCLQGPMGVCAGMLLWSPASRLTMLKQSANKQDLSNPFNQLSLLDKGKSILKNDGVRGFYRGSFGVVCAFSITDALGSILQASILNYFPQDARKNAPVQISSTSIAFTLAALATSPLEVVACHLRIRENNPQQFAAKTMQEASKQIYAARGLRGFFHASPALVAHSVVWHMVIPFTTLASSQ
jgi:hypothetical protein